MFNLCHDKYRRGFHVKFANGWTVSVQWGYGNYCENYHALDTPFGCQTAETACWQEGGEASEVTGYRSADEVAAYIMEVASRPTKSAELTAFEKILVCRECGDKLTGHEDESGTHCRWCTTCVDYRTDEERAAGLE